MTPEKLEQAIDILMENRGYIWCEVCGCWKIETDHNFLNPDHKK